MEKLYASLEYADAPAAIEWLVAIGLDAVARFDTQDGGVQHAELRRGGVAVVVSSSERRRAARPLVETSTEAGLCLGLDDVDDVDDTFARAVDAGGRAIIPPEDTERGGRRARVLDAEGNEWSFGTYRPASGRDDSSS